MHEHCTSLNSVHAQFLIASLVFVRLSVAKQGIGYQASINRTAEDRESYTMLTVIPKSWFSWDFSVIERSRAVAEIDVSWWREKGVLTVDGIDYMVYREGLMSGAFILELEGAVLAHAKKPNAFRRAFIIEYAGKQYTLRAKSAFQSTFLLLDGDREIGTLSPKGVFTRRATVDFPEEIPLPAKVFIIWLAVILWKRESDSSAGTGASDGGGDEGGGGE